MRHSPLTIPADVVVTIDTPDGPVYLASFDDLEPWRGHPDAHARTELMLRTAWRAAGAAASPADFARECARLRALHSQ